MKLLEKFGIYNKSDFFKIVIQFIRFGIVGLSNTIISLVVYWVCYYFFNIHYFISNFIAFVISVTNAYYWNNKYVFRKENINKKSHIKSYTKVFVSYGSTFLLGTILLYLWVDYFKISAGIAPIINLIITIPLNFILNKLWAFR